MEISRKHPFLEGTKRQLLKYNKIKQNKINALGLADTGCS